MKQPPVKIKCPECGGAGKGLTPRDMPYDDFPCEACDGTGEVYNYLTPEQWEAETGEKMLDTDPVWRLYDVHAIINTKDWILEEYSMTSKQRTCVVARPGQPKPLEDYRP